MPAPLAFITRVAPSPPETTTRVEATAATPETVPVVLRMDGTTRPAAPDPLDETAPLPTPTTVLGPRCPTVRLGHLFSGVGSLTVDTGLPVSPDDVAWETTDGRSGTLNDVLLDASRREVVALAKPGTAVVVGLRHVRSLRRLMVALPGTGAATSVQSALMPDPVPVDPSVRVLELYVDAGEVLLRGCPTPAASWADYDLAP